MQKQPDYDAEFTNRKVEDILMDRLQTLFSCLVTRNDGLFDESMDWIEYLLSYEEDSYKELVDFKNQLRDGLKMKLTEVYLASYDLDNTLARKRYKRINKILLEWQFRRDYLKKVIDIFFKRQILQYRRTTYAELKGVDDAESDGIGREGDIKEDTQPQ